ncbi:uncharacterized protein [Watersipora subatra]|uniref:uncharacterized protein n=1 Tax=Watersipora subatra TaxID=2589382 RepID=UPI00355B4279
MLFGAVVIALSISYTYSWVTGAPPECTWMTLSKGKQPKFDDKCMKGSIGWSYPQFPQLVEVTWSPGLTSPFQVCIIPSSSMQYLSCETPLKAGDRVGQAVDLRPLTDQHPRAVCIDSDEGEVSLNCRGNEWTLIEVIDFEIKQ